MALSGVIVQIKFFNQALKQVSFNKYHTKATKRTNQTGYNLFVTGLLYCREQSNPIPFFLVENNPIK